MHLMRFRGGTVREALALARAELGPEALVLSTQLVQARGWGARGREVEVAAAAERAVSEARPGRQEVRQPAPETVSGPAPHVAAALLGDRAGERAA